MEPLTISRICEKALDAMRLLDGQVATSITLVGENFLANAHPFLTQVPCNIVATPSIFSLDNTDSNTVNDNFVGFDVEESSCRQVVPLGKLNGIRFMSKFRFKLWWSTHWVGSSGKKMEYETPFMLLDKFDLGRPYVIMLPLIEGSFSTSLQPGVGDNVYESSFKSCVYMHGGDDLYNLVNEAMKVARLHLGSFRLMDEKRPPGIDGVKALQEEGCPPGMLTIDDGWQSICIDNDPIEKEGIDRAAVGDEKPYRLVKFQESYRFKDYENVYVWHALCDYWGGIRPNVLGMPESRIIDTHVSPGLLRTMKDFVVCNIVRDRVGLVPPELAHQMYEGLHSHLKSVGIDGVKIDVIEVFELLSEDYGGRVELAKANYKAHTVSLRKHFNGNAAISSMQQASGFFFLGTETIALVRVGDDFWHSDPYGDLTRAFWLQRCHMVHYTYNSLWMGNFILPDWDIDFVGKYNFDLLRKVALPDGSILKCQHYARNTRDCLFEDPLHDNKTALKVWNLNKFSGVLGMFNCHGGGWCPSSRKIKSFPEFAVLSNRKSPIFVEVVSMYAIYMYQSTKLKLMKWSQKIKVTLEPLKFELLIVSPVKILPKKQIQITPIGLVNILNSCDAIQLLAFDVDKNVVIIGVKGRGELKVFASEKPWGCTIDGRRAKFGYDEQMVTTEIPWVNSPMPSTVEYCF
ncbi:hypothetical protein V6Z11_D02G142300 [Gossypium hirsutum]